MASLLPLLLTLVLNGGSLGTSDITNCGFKNKSVMIAQDDVFATWVYKFQELNTIPNPSEKFRKQVIKTLILYTRRLVVYRNQR